MEEAIGARSTRSIGRMNQIEDKDEKENEDEARKEGRFVTFQMASKQLS